MDHGYHAYRFGGGGERLQTAQMANMAVPLTLACWFRPSLLSGSMELFSIQNTQGGTSGNAHRLNCNGTTALRAIQTGNTSNGIATAGAPVVGRWQHACGVFASNSSRTAYLNGVPGSANTTALVSTAASAYAILGRFDNGANNLFKGAVALPWVWNAALTATEVAALAAGVPPWMVRPEAAIHGWAFLHGGQRDRYSSFLIVPAGGVVAIEDGPPLSLRHDADWPAVAAATSSRGYLFLQTSGGFLSLVAA